LDQLCAKGNSIELIHYLAEDAQEWAKLRKALRVQVEALGNCCELAPSKAMWQPIKQFDHEVNEKINQLDQTVKDLLQLVCAFFTVRWLR
jgi:hypothetical protein